MVLTRLPWLEADDPLPPASAAFGEDSDAPGLVAAGGGLGIDRLREAYSKGIFPWFSPGQPVLWWSTDPRMVLRTGEFAPSASLRKAIRRFLRTPGCEIRIDHDTPAVIRACSRAPRPGQDGTWIVPQMIEAYAAWAAAGQVHSVETWADGELVGGLYGVNLGRMMFGESMFARRTDASKIALAALVAFCRTHAMPLVDCQQQTAHLASLGAAPIPRERFLAEIGPLLTQPPPVWTYHPEIWDALPGTRPEAG